MIPVPNWFLPHAPGLVRRALFSISIGGLIFVVLIATGLVPLDTFDY